MGTLISVQVTPTITSGSAYATGNALGGLLTLPSMGNFGGASLRSVVILDKANQKSALDVVFFGQAFTATADKSAIAISNADALNCMGSVNIATTDWITIGTGAVATKGVGTGGVKLPLIAQADTSFYAQLVVRGTPTFTSTTDIVCRFVFESMMGSQGI